MGFGHRFLSILLLSVICNSATFAGEIELSGIYLGKNLFVRNPLAEGNSFCVTNIFVNGQELVNLPRSSAIQIDLSTFMINESIKIKVVHKDGCAPSFINPDVITNSRGFAFLFTQIDDNSINWITTGESPDGYFELEKVKWKGWQRIDSITGKEQIDNNQYSVEAKHYAGDNQYRIIFYENQGEVFKSEEVNFYSLIKPVTFFPIDKVIDLISLSRATDYEIYNETGDLILEGFGDYINVDHLDYDEYTIIIENEPAQIYKPKPEIIYKPRKKRKNGGD